MAGLSRRRNQGMIKPVEIKAKNEVEGAVEEVEGEPLSPGSTVFHSRTFNIHVLAIIGCKTPIDVDVLKAKLPLTLLKHPRFSSIVVGDRSKGEQLTWVRTEVDLDKHIIIPEIHTNQIESPEKYVEDYIHNLSKTTLDKSKPLWDLHLLQLAVSEEVKAIGIFRIHHSLGDGMSLISLLLALTRKISDPEGLPTIPVQKKRHSHSRDNNDKFSLKGLFWRLIMSLWWVLQLSSNTVIDVIMFFATMLFLEDTKTPLKGPPGVESTPRRVVFRTFSLDDMKLVKNAMNATINDVALGITQAGLSRYLSRIYGNDGRSHQEVDKILKKIRLRSILLINLRPAGDIQALADFMGKNEEAKWGNSVGFALLPFIIGLRDDPLDYIREVKAIVDRKKHSLETLYTYSISEIVMKVFGTKVASTLSHRINSHTTMAFSNLVGPVEEIGFYGHPMAFLAPSSYGQPHALMINFQSYVNKMTLVLSVDEGAVPDPHQLCDDIVESLKLVKNAVITQGLARGGEGTAGYPDLSPVGNF